MGHYDDCYEAENANAANAARRRNIRLMTQLDPILQELDSIMRQNLSNNHPFKTCWFDFQKEYIAWQYEKGLIIKDPQILIDVLKDEA